MSNTEITVLTLTENGKAHGTEYLLERQMSEGLAEVVYALGDAGGYFGVVASIGITEDHEGDYYLDTAEDASDFHGSLDEAVAAAQRQLAASYPRVNKQKGTTPL